jgi:hypothetical protein
MADLSMIYDAEIQANRLPDQPNIRLFCGGVSKTSMFATATWIIPYVGKKSSWIMRLHEKFSLSCQIVILTAVAAIAKCSHLEFPERKISRFFSALFFQGICSDHPDQNHRRSDD